MRRRTRRTRSRMKMILTRMVDDKGEEEDEAEDEE